MSSKKLNPFKDFQSNQIQRSSRKIFTAHYACRNAALNLTPVTGTTNGFIFQIINSLIESWGVRLTWFDCNLLPKVYEGFLVITRSLTNRKLEIACSKFFFKTYTCWDLYSEKTPCILNDHLTFWWPLTGGSTDIYSSQILLLQTRRYHGHLTLLYDRITVHCSWQILPLYLYFLVILSCLLYILCK